MKKDKDNMETSENISWNESIRDAKYNAIEKCQQLNSIPMRNEKMRIQVIHELLGTVGSNPAILPDFHCDNGKNIHVGDDFLANYHVTILDSASVHIGDHVMIGPNTLIATINHPISPMERRMGSASAKSITIGNDVWVGGNCTILPGVTIGNNVVVAAGAVVNKDVPDNCVVGGVPAKVIKEIENAVFQSKEI